MSKILKDSTYALLKSKADAFDKFFKAIEGSEDVTNIDERIALIVEALEAEPVESSEALEALQAKLDKANAQITALETKHAQATEEVTRLQELLDLTPGEAPAAIVAKGEPGAEAMTIAEYADKHAGDVISILDRALEEGLI